MAVNTLNCNRLTPLGLKGLKAAFVLMVIFRTDSMIRKCNLHLNLYSVIISILVTANVDSLVVLSVQFTPAGSGDVQTQGSRERTDSGRSQTSFGQVSRPAEGGAGSCLREDKYASAAELQVQTHPSLCRLVF